MYAFFSAVQVEQLKVQILAAVASLDRGLAANVSAQLLSCETVCKLGAAVAVIHRRHSTSVTEAL